MNIESISNIEYNTFSVNTRIKSTKNLETSIINNINKINFLNTAYIIKSV